MVKDKPSSANPGSVLNKAEGPVLSEAEGLPRGEEKKYSKFRVKVLRVLLFVGVLPLVIVSVVSLFTVVNTRLKNVSELQAQVITAVEEKVNRYLDQKISVFNLVIDLNPDNISEINKNTLQFLARGLKEAAKDINEISFVDKYGKEIVKESQVQGIEAGALKNISQEESFQTAINGKNYFGPVYYTLAGPIMHMASQIENKDREIIGIILAEVNLSPLENEIGTIKLGKHGFIYLLDRQGSLILSSSKSFAMSGENLRYLPLVRDVMGGIEHNGMRREDRYKNSMQQRVIFSGRTMGQVPNQSNLGTGQVGWSIISEWPWDDAFSDTWVMLQRFLLIMAVSLVLIVLFGMFFARIVVKPLEMLSKGADEIGKGNFDYEIDIKTGDELEKLGERFKNMKKVLKENQQLRDEFVFVAAHELRAPVTVIKGYLSMMLEGDYGKLTPEMEKNLKTASNLNERLVRLVHDLLEVARSEAGRMEVELLPVSITESVGEVVNEFMPQAKEKGIILVYRKLPKDIKVMADSYKLKEVVTNLISNAVKYTLTEGIVEVSHEINGNSLVTHFKDQGMGISKPNLEKLFGKFFRIKTAETKKIEGTGLGLFICKEIMARMGGKIWATSEVGRGSTFSFSLKIAP